MIGVLERPVSKGVYAAFDSGGKKERRERKVGGFVPAHLISRVGLEPRGAR